MMNNVHVIFPDGSYESADLHHADALLPNIDKLGLSPDSEELYSKRLNRTDPSRRGYIGIINELTALLFENGGVRLGWRPALDKRALFFINVENEHVLQRHYGTIVEIFKDNPYGLDNDVEIDVIVEFEDDDQDFREFVTTTAQFSKYLLTGGKPGRDPFLDDLWHRRESTSSLLRLGFEYDTPAVIVRYIHGLDWRDINKYFSTKTKTTLELGTATWKDDEYGPFTFVDYGGDGITAENIDLFIERLEIKAKHYELDVLYDLYDSPDGEEHMTVYLGKHTTSSLRISKPITSLELRWSRLHCIS